MMNRCVNCGTCCSHCEKEEKSTKIRIIEDLCGKLRRDWDYTVPANEVFKLLKAERDRILGE